MGTSASKITSRAAHVDEGAGGGAAHVDEGEGGGAAVWAAVESAKTPEDLQTAVKDVTWVHVAPLSPAEAKRAFDALAKALEAVDPAATDSQVATFQSLVNGSSDGTSATARLLVKRVLTLQTTSGFKTVSDKIKGLQNLLALRCDSAEGGAGSSAGSSAGIGCNRHLRGRLSAKAVMTPFARAVQSGAKAAAVEASKGARTDVHGNFIGDEFDLVGKKALQGTSCCFLVGTPELENGDAGGPSPVFDELKDKGIALTKVAFGACAAKFAIERPASTAALRKAQIALHAAKCAFGELNELLGNATDADSVGAVQEAETAVEKAQQAVEAALIDGYWLLPADVSEFEAMLSSVTQVWLVSGKQPLLPEAFIASLARAHNEEGLGLHVMGDNDPYFQDANALLAAVFQGTRESVLLRGNYLGAGYVMGPVDADFTTIGAGAGAGTSAGAGAGAGVSANVRGGFRADSMLTTGVSCLHSGYTVADVGYTGGTLTPVIATTNDPSPTAQLVCTLAFRPARGKRGPLVVGGAFTTLFQYIWRMAAGAARFYANIAAYLALQPDAHEGGGAGKDGGEGAPEGVSDGWTTKDDLHKDKATGLCTFAAFCGPCAISHVVCIPGPSAHVGSVCALYKIEPGDATNSVLSVPGFVLANPEGVKTNEAFNNPLAAGAANGASLSPFVFSEDYLRLAAGRPGLANKCPFTGREWIRRFLPCVAIGPNRAAHEDAGTEATAHKDAATEATAHKDAGTEATAHKDAATEATAHEEHAGTEATAREEHAATEATLTAGFAHNARRVKEFADELFFGGPLVGNTSLLMLAGALWSMLRRMQAERAVASKGGANHKGEGEGEDEGEEQTLVTIRALEFLLRQLVAHVSCAPNMTAAGTGVRVPLFAAFLQYCAADLTSFCLEQVECLVDLVTRFGWRAPTDKERADMRRTVCRAFIIEQLAAVCAAAKKPDTTKYDFFVEAAQGLVGFQPRTNLVDITVPVEVLGRWDFAARCRGKPSSVDWQTLAFNLGVDPVPPLVTWAIGAKVLGDAFAHWWSGKLFPASQHPFNCKTSTVIERWLAEQLKFRALWNCEDCAGKVAVTADDVRVAVDEAVVKRLTPITYDSALVPFASCFGTSVLNCAHCDHVFSTPAEAAQLLQQVDAGCREATASFRAGVIEHLHRHGNLINKGSGSCTATTAGGSLHRAVQLKMLQLENRSARGDEDVARIADDVQHALVRDRQGTESLAPSFTRAATEAAIRGYMRLRSSGAAEPTLRADGTLNILFAEKLRGELQVLRMEIGAQTDECEECDECEAGGGCAAAGGGGI